MVGRYSHSHRSTARSIIDLMSTDFVNSGLPFPLFQAAFTLLMIYLNEILQARSHTDRLTTGIEAKQESDAKDITDLVHSLRGALCHLGSQKKVRSVDNPDGYAMVDLAVVLPSTPASELLIGGRKFFECPDGDLLIASGEYAILWNGDLVPAINSACEWAEKQSYL